MSKASSKRIVKRCDEIRSLMAEFGLKAYAYDPGVACKDANGNTVDLDGPIWAWLEPLLIELRKRRAGRGKGPKENKVRRAAQESVDAFDEWNGLPDRFPTQRWLDAMSELKEALADSGARPTGLAGIKAGLREAEEMDPSGASGEPTREVPHYDYKSEKERLLAQPLANAEFDALRHTYIQTSADTVRAMKAQGMKFVLIDAQLAGEMDAAYAAGLSASGAQPCVDSCQCCGNEECRGHKLQQKVLCSDCVKRLAAPAGHALSEDVLELLKSYKEGHEMEWGCDAEPCESCTKLNALLRASQAGSQVAQLPDCGCEENRCFGPITGYRCRAAGRK